MEECHLLAEETNRVPFAASSRREDAAMLLSAEHGSSSQDDETPALRTDENL